MALLNSDAILTDMICIKTTSWFIIQLGCLDWYLTMLGLVLVAVMKQELCLDYWTDYRKMSCLDSCWTCGENVIPMNWVKRICVLVIDFLVDVIVVAVLMFGFKWFQTQLDRTANFFVVKRWDFWDFLHGYVWVAL